MKSSIQKNREIKDVLLYFKPVSTTFVRPELKTYKIYLQKDVQIIGQIQQNIALRTYENSYNFKNTGKGIPFRVVNAKNSLYQIAIYQITDQNKEVLYESSDINLKNFLLNYEREFNAIDEQILKSSNKKQIASILELWKVLSNNFTKKNFSTAIKYDKSGTVLEYNIVTQNYYDVLLENDIQVKQQKQRQRKIRKSNTLSKAATLPDINFLKNRNSAQQTASAPALTLNKLNLSSKEAFDHYHKQLPISKKELLQLSLPRQKDKDEQAIIISEMPQQSKYFPSNDPQEQANALQLITEANEQQLQNQEPLDDRSRNLQQEIEKALLKNNYKVKKDTEELNQQLQQRNKEGCSPEIYVEGYQNIKTRSTLLSQPVKSLHLELQSQVSSPLQKQPASSSVKSNVVVLMVMCVYVLLIYLLMHPINKIA